MYLLGTLHMKLQEHLSVSNISRILQISGSFGLNGLRKDNFKNPLPTKGLIQDVITMLY